MADILHNREAIGRISKCSVELGALVIKFKPRTTIKSQALVDFLEQWCENQIPAPPNIPEHWVMYFDGSLKLEGGGVGVLFISPKGGQLKYMLQILFKVSNNEAEYEALLHGLRLARHQATTCVRRFSTHLTTSKQIMGHQQGNNGCLHGRNQES